ncbi:MAG: 4-hydroxy-tetrahydrodipicolinate synthase [Proteobacteria bacterium]|nr:4-hydroxy-tetrahydrodipicolinate synthase [Pseudomonadota bacterium]
MQFKGAFTALITPFKNGAVDEDAYRRHIEWQIEQGINGLVPCGTTGESATLSHAEHGEVIRICVEQAKGRVPVLAGAGSNNTLEAIELTRYAKEAGADGALLITPYYNKPTPAGLVAHFKAISQSVPLPFVLYNVPSRTALNVLPATLKAIKDAVPEMVGIKEATGNLQQISDMIEVMGPDFNMLSGDDFTVLPLLSLGGCGVISVVSNIVPDKMSGMVKASNDGDMKTARRLHFEMQPLIRAMFLETNPIPLKTSLTLMGRIGPELRLPLVDLLPENLDKLKGVLKGNGLI